MKTEKLHPISVTKSSPWDTLTSEMAGEICAALDSELGLFSDHYCLAPALQSKLKKILFGTVVTGRSISGQDTLILKQIHRMLSKTLDSLGMPCSLTDKMIHELDHQLKDILHHSESRALALQHGDEVRSPTGTV